MDRMIKIGLLCMGLGTVVVGATGSSCLPEVVKLTVEGVVTAKDSGQSVDGIEVACSATINDAEHSGSAISGEAVAEDAGSEDGAAGEPGAYRCVIEVPTLGDQAETEGKKEMVKLVFTDADGAENGGDFAPLEQELEVEYDVDTALDVQLELAP